MKETTTESWLPQFRRAWTNLPSDSTAFWSEKMEDFIRETLSKERERILGVIEELRQTGITEILERQLDSQIGADILYEREAKGYSQALSDIQEAIKVTK